MSPMVSALVWISVGFIRAALLASLFGAGESWILFCGEIWAVAEGGCLSCDGGI